jgi:DNA-binding XRE family transcriptional regulator
MNSTSGDKTIRYYRKKIDINQSDLAKTLGITVTDMSFIENKKLYPTPELAELISQILKVPIGALWKESELNLILDRR